jgi:hypothetical protein
VLVAKLEAELEASKTKCTGLDVAVTAANTKVAELEEEVEAQKASSLPFSALHHGFCQRAWIPSYVG